MKLMPHWGDCQQEIKELKELLALAQEQNVNYMRDLGELTCKLRMAKLERMQCKDCPEKTKQTIVENPEIVVR